MMQITDHVGRPRIVWVAYAGPNHSLLTWEGDSELLRSAYLADSPFSWAHIAILALDPAGHGATPPGHLLIRTARSKQPSNNSLTLWLKRSCRVSRLAHGPSRLRTFEASAPIAQASRRSRGTAAPYRVFRV